MVILDEMETLVPQVILEPLVLVVKMVLLDKDLPDLLETPELLEDQDQEDHPELPVLVESREYRDLLETPSTLMTVPLVHQDPQDILVCPDPQVPTSSSTPTSWPSTLRPPPHPSVWTV